MASDKAAPTVADYLAFVLSPTLIVAMVGSLVFFLLEVLYAGGASEREFDYTWRLQWILFFFVVAAVLIARISMRQDIAGRAVLYGLALGIPTYLGLQWFVEYPEGPWATFSWGINIVLIALVWWSAHKLTHDCTRIDEDEEEDGEGLLQAAGLNARSVPNEEPADSGRAKGWWQRYKEYRERTRKKRTPGVWVVYFSLAALPIFGLGQALIPVADEARRQYVFWLMVLYIGSGLGLLLTTCFQGLRRYLRKRQVRMTTSMAAVWLAMGGGLIVALLAVGAFLPRPQAEYSVLEAVGLTSPKRDASNFDVLGNSPGHGDGKPGSQGAKDGQQPGDKSGKGGQPNSKDPNAKPGESGSKDGQGGKNGQGGNQQNTNQGQGQGQKPGEQNSGSKPGDKGQPNGQSQEKKPNDQGSPSPSQQRPPTPQHPDQDPDQASQPENSNPVKSLWDVLMGLAPVLKWVVFGILALVVLVVVGRALLKFLANFSTWAQDLLAWWRGLFGWWHRPAPGDDDDGPSEARGAPPRPFSDFRNPFHGGGKEWPVDRLVRYTFEALQAWAAERDFGRRPDETPLEFADRLGGDVPALEGDVRKLAALVARSLYARGSLPPSARDAVRQFWDRLEAVVEQPMSA